MTAESRAGKEEVCGATVAEVNDKGDVIRYRTCQRTEDGEGCMILIIQESGLWAKRTKKRCGCRRGGKAPTLLICKFFKFAGLSFSTI